MTATIILRELRPRDAFWCWRLAHDATVRSVSFTKKPPRLRDHVRWMWRWTRPGAMAYVPLIYRADGRRVPGGHVRIWETDRTEGDERELSVSLFPYVRGRGVGTTVLRQVRKGWNRDDGNLIAYVNAANEPAFHAFVRAGWTPNFDGKWYVKFHGDPTAP